MVRLHARAIMSSAMPASVVARVTRNADLPPEARAHHALLVSGGRRTGAAADGYAAMLVGALPAPSDTNELNVELPPDLAYIDEGDVIRLDPPRQHVDVLYRRGSPHNSLLVTERCNSRCLMCSQPPVPHDDGYLVDDLLKAIPLF